MEEGWLGAGDSYSDMVSILSRTLTQANRFIMHEMDAAGLSGLATSHGDILRQLFECDGLSMRAIAEHVDRDPSTVTALVKRLVAEGYVTTRRSERDRRTVVVSLTERGKALEQDFSEISRRLRYVQTAGMGSEDVRAARRVLLRMQENFRDALGRGARGEGASAERSERRPGRDGAGV